MSTARGTRRAGLFSIFELPLNALANAHQQLVGKGLRGRGGVFHAQDRISLRSAKHDDIGADFDRRVADIDRDEIH